MFGTDIDAVPIPVPAPVYTYMPVPPVCGRQGTSGMHPRGFHYLIFILMVKRILLLALISSRTAVGFVGVRSGSDVVGPGKGATRRLRVSALPSCVCLSLRGSIGLGHRRWICYPGSEGEQIILIPCVSPVLGDHLKSWDRKPEGPNRYRYCCPTELTEVSGTGVYVVPN